MKTFNEIQHEEKLAKLRKKWSDAKEREDAVMMGIYERQARALEISRGK